MPANTHSTFSTLFWKGPCQELGFNSYFVPATNAPVYAQLPADGQAVLGSL